MPRVGVLMPVHNGARFIGAAIDSVRNQTFTDFELIVIDDGSTDETPAIVSGYADERIRMVRHDENRGLPRALNAGLAATTAPYVARLDCDDVARADRLAKQSEFLDRHAAVALVGSRARRIDVAGRVLGVVERPVSAAGIRWLAMIANPFIHSATMFRREAALAAGGYRDDVPLAEDFDLWGRLMARHDVHNFAEALVDYRDWPQSIMSAAAGNDADARKLRRSLAAIIPRHVERELSMTIAESEAELLAGFTVGIPRQDLGGFLALFDRLRLAFEGKHSEASSQRDYRRTVARAFSTIAQRLTPRSRRTTLTVFGHAVRQAPGLAGEIPWMRAAALLTLGR